MSNNINPTIGNFIASSSAGSGSASARSSSGGSSSSWYAAMSKAWGQTLDGQAAKITQLSDAIGAGDDKPSQMIELTAESLKMQFMSNNASTSQNSVGQALETLGKKQ